MAIGQSGILFAHSPFAIRIHTMYIILLGILYYLFYNSILILNVVIDVSHPWRSMLWSIRLVLRVLFIYHSVMNWFNGKLYWILTVATRPFVFSFYKTWTLHLQHRYIPWRLIYYLSKYLSRCYVIFSAGIANN